MTKFIIIFAAVILLLTYILFHVVVLIQLKTVVFLCLISSVIGFFIGLVVKK